MKHSNRILGKRLAYSAVALACLAWGSACSDNDKSDETDMNVTESTKESLNKAFDATQQAATYAKDATQSAWSDFSDLTHGKKEDAVEFLNRQFIALDQQVELLTEKVEGSTAEGRVKAREALEALKEERTDLKLQLEKTKNATEKGWSEVKLETKKKWDSFTESLQELKNKVSD
ncbi:hypothetical protein [Pelagicoccus sp. SDUM812002]|uniref:hypothetical protein n=1 Tax=Pelagicoccus sp. SDUM812002 TaxID=3041266 RepID=UPI00280FCC78|nr:hypothetical protein [Pelagicoccus sp. SDUM812002]MDQ8185282.1 hypothetical protein [Pelagicoccus sp. SDUM812002]